MFSLFCNSCRGHLSNTIRLSNLSLRKYTSQAAVLEIPLPEKPVEKEKTTIIKCKHESLNFYSGQTYDKFQPIQLASKGWRHRKSIGDYFTLYPDAIPEDSLSNVEITSFDESDLNRKIIENLKENDLIKPSEIQSISIPVLLSGKNSIIAAETGCGKTLAYLVPIIEQILKWKRVKTEREFNEPLALVISPSRDLTQQLGLVAKKIVKDMDIKIRVVVGGRTKQQMINPTIQDVDLLIGSFGAVSKLTTTGIYKMSSVRHVVLDEADTLLDDSFNKQLRHFLKKIKFGFAGPEGVAELPNSAQLTLVSATMPTYLPETLEEIVNTDSLVRITTDKLHRIMPQVVQKFVRLNRTARPAEILKIAKGNAAKKQQTIVFCNTIKTCEWLYLFLNELGLNCCCTHGDVPAAVRAHKFADFQKGIYSLLATTDACARGLDTVQVKHIVNFDFPLYMADYIHRCGRTGRLGNREKCYVTNFITGDREIDLVQKIEQSIRTSSPLPSVNGNITKIINNQIRKEITHTQTLLNQSDAPESLKR